MDLWNTTERRNLQIIGIPEGEEREKGGESLFKGMMVENFLNLDEIWIF